MSRPIYPIIANGDPPYIYFAFGIVAIALGWYFLRPVRNGSDCTKFRIRNSLHRIWLSLALTAVHLAFAGHLSILVGPSLFAPLIVLWSTVLISITLVVEAIADRVTERRGARGGYWSKARVCASVLRLIMFVAVLSSVAWACLQRAKG